jgi:hypothetical protein
MNFFSDLHRSIFDPSFYKDAVGRSAGQIALFLLKLVILAAAVSAFSKTYYLLHSERGIAPIASAIFGNMEIRDGRLKAEVEMPYEPPKDLVAGLLNRLMGGASFFERVPDNFLAVDTRAEAQSDPDILMGESSIRFREARMEVPYNQLVGNNFQFTVPAIQEFLNRNALSMALLFFATSLLGGLASAALSAFFLSFAAYLFSLERTKGFWYFARIACFSITPVIAGTAIASLTGVAANWIWHILIIASTVVMFRAMTHISAGNAPEEKGNAL